MALPENRREVDDIENIREVLTVNLKPNRHGVGFVKVRARGGVDLESRIDTVAGKINAIDHWLTVFGERLLRGTVDLEGQSGVILNSARDQKRGFTW